MHGKQIDSLLAGARHGRVTIRNFRVALPELYRQLSVDRGSIALESWGLCSNFDQEAAARIVDRKLLTLIGRIVRCPIRIERAYHAGLMCTYGYLLSNLGTPAGFKHDRWTSGRLESGLGLPAGTLLGGNGRSTLLQNVTALFLGLIGQDENLSELHDVDATIFDLVSRTNHKSKWEFRIVESIEIQGGCRYELNSYLCPLESEDSDFHTLLIYSVTVGDAPPQLITGFPISKASLDALLDRDCFGIARAIGPCYGSIIPGFPAEGFGSRELISRTVA
ncbi:MAG TPA: hypothetical protein DDW52_19855 [Planctomycetaceae bacterium]|nr:hypothetical protein [Planctomycetaceae bacterium]